jgi:drug/metabolite transporter (DMT)-like permease
MTLAFAGILVLFGENLFKPAAHAWLGDLMLFGAAILWAATTLTIKASRLAAAASEKTLLYQLFVSAVALPPLSLLLGEPGIGVVTPAIAAALLFQIVVVATLSYLGWFWLIRHYPATRLSAFSFLTPVFGVLAGGLLLGEPLTAPVFVALGLVAAGIWMANRPSGTAADRATKMASVKR